MERLKKIRCFFWMNEYIVLCATEMHQLPSSSSGFVDLFL
jgi:hypothetical protein